MPEYLPFDVFLSHSSKDKTVVRELAERLRGDGVRVWFDEWELRPGDSVPAKIEEGLERSRMSAKGAIWYWSSQASMPRARRASARGRTAGLSTEEWLMKTRMLGRRALTYLG